MANFLKNTTFLLSYQLDSPNYSLRFAWQERFTRND